MITIIVIAVFCFLLYVSVCFRLLVTHPLSTGYYGVKDFYHYIKYHLYDLAPMGKIKGYCADFGGGKTLSAVHEVVSFYHRYDNKKIFDVSRLEWVTQKVLVLSNVEFTSIPFQPMTSLAQLVELQEHNRNIDLKNHTRTCVIVVIDEASSQLNSRSYASNFSKSVIGALVTCRHYNTSLLYTSQVFTHVDKLLRDDTMLVIQCHKVWRFMVHSVYNAHVLEYASDPTIIQPLYRTGFFVRDKDYKNYDTLALVENLSHSAKDGDMLSEEEILANRANILSDDLPLNKKGKRRMK